MFKQILLASFAIFSMFFGSGNLVFPLIIGREAGDQWQIGALGIIVTGVLIPLMGLLGVILTQGKLNIFFRPFGRWGSILLPLVIICLLGPFGVIPRCITVAYASMKTIIPGLQLSLFSLLWCILLIFLTPHRELIVPVIGRYFTPIKLTTLVVLIALGLKNAPSFIHSSANISIFYKGIVGGYQTMDLLASFFFALSIVHYFQQDKATSLVKNITSAALGCILLALFYIGFVYIGAAYQPLIKDLPAEDILPFIATKCLGSTSAIFLNGTIIIACLTTSIALMAAFTDFIADMLKNRVSLLTVNIVSGVVTAVVSTLKFKGIALFLTPILELLYPALIILTVFNIGMYFFKDRSLS